MSIDGSAEKWELLITLIHGDSARFAWEAATLHEHGYEMVEVEGLAQVIWRKGERLLTTERAMNEAAPPETIRDPRGG